MWYIVFKKGAREREGRGERQTEREGDTELERQRKKLLVF